MVPVRDSTPEEIARLAGIMLELPGECTRLFERLPGPLWSTQPSASGDELSRRVRRAFDPDLLLNPGIFGLTA
jgi:FAD/FMN-containing dehydrogenase